MKNAPAPGGASACGPCPGSPGGFAYTANAGSGSIGRYAVTPGGTLTALGSTLVENDPASHPLDEGVSAGQDYLYVLADGLSQVVGYRVGTDGSLTQVTSAPAAAGSAGIGASSRPRPQPSMPVGRRTRRSVLRPTGRWISPEQRADPAEIAVVGAGCIPVHRAPGPSGANLR